MEKEYKELTVPCGYGLDKAIEMLLSSKEDCFINFNGTKLYSDNITVDSAYLAHTGFTKAEYDEKDRKERKNIDLQEKLINQIFQD